MQTTISLAPFQGLTDKYFRTLFLKIFGGVDRVYAPFVSGSGTGQISKSKLSDLLMNDNSLPHTIPQIISNDSCEIVLFANTLAEYGYRHINWNLGCPFRRIASKIKGSGMLPYPNRIKNILDDVFDSQLAVELSIKTRMGYNSENEIFDVIKIFNQYPVSEIIIHPRVGKQLYKGAVYLEEFNKCIDLSVHPVAYNGDIHNRITFEELKAKFSSIKHWMIGRGLLINPFLAEQIKGHKISDAERRERMNEFITQLMDMAKNRMPNERKTVDYMKAVTYYLVGSFKDAELIFSRLKKVNTTMEYLDVFNEIISLPMSNDFDIRNYFLTGLKHV